MSTNHAVSLVWPLYVVGQLKMPQLALFKRLNLKAEIAVNLILLVPGDIITQ